MSLIALIPLFISAFFLIFKSPEKVFTLVYIPVLLLLPQSFDAEIIGLPNLTFAQSAIIPIASLFLLYKTLGNRYHKSKFCFTDCLIWSFIIIGCLTEYANQNIRIGNLGITYFWESLVSIYFPYTLAKNFFHKEHFIPTLIRTIVICLFISVCLAAFEWRFYINFPLQFLESFFPGQGRWTTLTRFGLVRIAGPYYQTISFGIAIGIALFFNHWLMKYRQWGATGRLTPASGRIIGYAIQCTLMIGLVLTISRGPWLGVLCGSLFIGLGTTQYPKLSTLLRVLFFSFLCLLAYQFYQHYGKIDISRVESRFSGNIVYRIQLLKEYMQYVYLKPYLGWGSLTLPIAGGLKSIDNQFLYVALKNGLIALFVYTFTIFLIPLRLFLRGWRATNEHFPDKSFTFTLFSIYICLFVSFLTVYMGNQIFPLFFILTGLSQGLLQSKREFLSQEAYHHTHLHHSPVVSTS